MKTDSTRLSMKHRLVGVIATAVALLGLATQDEVIAMASIGVGIGVIFASLRFIEADDDTPAKKTFTRSLAVEALIIWPVGANVFVILLIAIAGGSLDELPLEAGPPVSALAALGAGVSATQHESAPGSHGWWSLAGAALSVLVFGVLFGALTP